MLCGCWAVLDDQRYGGRDVLSDVLNRGKDELHDIQDVEWMHSMIY